MVIFGATGDLTQRKLIPALFHLFQKKILPPHFYIVGFSRRPYTNEDFKEFLEQAINKYHQHKFSDSQWQEFIGKCYYQQGNFGEKQGYIDMIDKLKEFDELLSSCVPRFFYLATPPDNYPEILKYLHSTKLSEGCGPYFAPHGGATKGKQGSGKWTKIMIEKPFGKSLDDALKLDRKLAQFFNEEQIYRIDHYLGKEAVQNILAFRFGNTIFDPVWNNKYIDHVQVTIAETLGVETRGNFFEGIGTLRDMAQSHLLELMTAITMSEPRTLDATGIRNARTESIKEIICIEPNQVARRAIRGQYGQGSVNGKPVARYRVEPKVAPDSNTETFAALKLFVDSPRWQDVPFYLRTGKRLTEKATQISVVFKEPKLKMLGRGEREIVANTLTFCIEPNEKIELSLNAKRVGFERIFNQIPLSFNYDKTDGVLPESYEKLLVDVMRGDQTLFTRTDEVQASWKLIARIGERWQESKDPGFPNYAAGSWGPKAAEELITKDGREWLVK